MVRCPGAPTAKSRSSVSGVATRVKARTLAYESSPRARAWASRGSVPRARATRTRSRAAPRSSPTRQLSQAAQERNPVFQPSRVSNSRMRGGARSPRRDEPTARRSRRLADRARTFPWRVSLLLGRLYTSDFAPSGRRDERRSRDGRHFCDEQTRGDVAELLRRARTISTRCWQRAATVYARSCQAKNYGQHAAVPTDCTPGSNIRRSSGNRTRHAAVEQIKTVSKIGRPAGNQTPGRRGSRRPLSLPPQARVKEIAQTVAEKIDPEHRE